MLAESGVNPSRLERVRADAGYTTSSEIGGKAANLDKTKRNDINFQLGYLKGELESGAFASKPEDRDLLQILKSTDSIPDATKAFLEKFERPASYVNRNDSTAAMQNYDLKLKNREGRSNTAAPIVAKVYEGPVYNPGASTSGPKI